MSQKRAKLKRRLDESLEDLQRIITELAYYELDCDPVAFQIWFEDIFVPGVKTLHPTQLAQLRPSKIGRMQST